MSDEVVPFDLNDAIVQAQQTVTVEDQLEERLREDLKVLRALPFEERKKVARRVFGAGMAKTVSEAFNEKREEITQEIEVRINALRKELIDLFKEARDDINTLNQIKVNPAIQEVKTLRDIETLENIKTKATNRALKAAKIVAGKEKVVMRQTRLVDTRVNTAEAAKVFSE